MIYYKIIQLSNLSRKTLRPENLCRSVSTRSVERVQDRIKKNLDIRTFIYLEYNHHLTALNQPNITFFKIKYLIQNLSRKTLRSENLCRSVSTRSVERVQDRIKKKFRYKNFYLP